MAITVKRTKILLDADASRMKKGYKEAEGATKKLADKADEQFKKIAKRIAAAFSVAVIGKFFKDSASLAINAQETFSKFATVFEKNLGAAGKAVDNLRQNYGLSELASKSLLSATGDLLVGLGAQEASALGLSERVQGLSADISSFQNLQGGAARASEIITKAMLGERDALISLGVKISEVDVKQRLMALGQADLTGKALMLAKAEITLALITEQSGKAIGDYARTSDSAANQLKRLSNVFEDFQIAVGDSILKTDGAQDSLSAVSDLLQDPGFIEAISTIASSLVSLFGGLLPLLAGVIKGISNVVTVAIDAVNRIVSTVRNIPVLSEIIDVYEGLAGLIRGDLAQAEEQQIKAIQTQNAQFNQLNDTLKRTRDGLELTSEFMRELTRELVGIEDPAKKAQAKLNAIKFETLANNAKLTDEQLRKIIDDFSDIEDPARRYQKILVAISRGKYDTETQKLSSELKKLTIEYAISEEAVKGASKETKDLSKETGIVTGLTKKQKKAIEAARKEFESLSVSVGILTQDKLKALNTEGASLKKIFDANTDTFKDNSDQSKIFEKKLNDLITTFGGLNKSPQVIQDLNKQFRELNQIPFFDEEDNWEEFGKIADGLNTEIMPEATLKFQETQDKIKGASEEIEGATKKTADLSGTFTALSTTIKNALDALGAIGINLGKLPAILGGASQGLNAIGGGIKATKNTMGGLTGALGKMGGYAAIAAGAITILGSIIGAVFGKKRSSELMTAQANLQGITGLTQDWTKKLEELGKELGGQWGGERAFSQELGNIIRDTPATLENFTKLSESIRHIGGLFKDGRISAQEAAAGYGDAFAAIAEQAEELGVTGGVAFTGLIINAKELGLNVKEIADWTEKNMASATKGWMQVLEEMGGVSIPILDEQVRLFKLLESIPPGITAQIQGATEALTGLSNVGRLLPEDFAQFGLIVDDVKAKLEAQGITGADAAKAMKPLLEKIIFLSNEYGFAIDDGTKALIDQGVEAGHLSTDLRSDTQKQIDLQERMVEALERLTKGFGFMEDSIDGVGDAAERMAGRMNDNLSQTQKNLSGIADTINTDVVNALNNMGDTSDDVMWKNSIIPDTIEWQKENEKVRDQLKDDMVNAITTMGESFTGEMSGMMDMQGTLYDQIAGDMADLNQLYGGLGLEKLAEARAAGGLERYGVVSEERKGEMTEDFKFLAHLFQADKEQILGSKSGLDNLIRDLEGLTVVGELQAQFETFLASMINKQNMLEAGKVYDPGTNTFLAAGTNGFEPIRTAIVGEAGIELVEQRDNMMKVTPLERGGVSPGGSRSINVSMRISAAEGLDPYRLADNLKFVVKNNINGFNDLLESV